MSAASRPQTDEQAEPATGSADAEGWALLEGLRRRLDEQANQHRKTQTEVRQLADSIAALVDAQRRRSRWLNVNSFVAYVIFTLLCGGAFFYLYQSRARALVGDRDRVISEREAAVRRADDASKQAAARDAAAAKALEAYNLLEQGKREEAAAKLAELANAPLSKLERTVLDTRARQAEVMQVDAALKSVTAAFKAGRHADVVAPLEAALALESTGPRAAQMHYYLGVAYAKGGSLDNAIAHLQAAVAADVDVEDARFQLASALDRAGQWGKAKVEYDRFATAHPMSSYAAFAMRRGATLARAPAVAPKKPAAPGAAAPGAAAPGAAAPKAAAPTAAAPKASAPASAAATPSGASPATAEPVAPPPAPKAKATPAKPAPQTPSESDPTAGE
jgi:tetratricopeptide (TPR) repeat protein